MPMSAEPGRSSASRVLAVLQAFDGADVPLTLTAVATNAGLPLTTTHRIAQELVEWGAIERNAAGRYQLGLRLWRIASQAPRQRVLRHVARPALERLHEATRETVQLAVLDGGSVVVLEKVSGTWTAPNATEVAGVLPAHATAVGKVLLGFEDQATVDDVLKRPLVAYTPRTITRLDVVSVSLEQVRRAGFAVVRGEMTLGTNGAAAPIFDGTGRVVAAVGILTSATKLTELVVELRATAAWVSRRLGSVHGGPSSRGVGGSYLGTSSASA